MTRDVPPRGVSPQASTPARRAGRRWANAGSTFGWIIPRDEEAWPPPFLRWSRSACWTTPGRSHDSGGTDGLDRRGHRRGHRRRFLLKVGAIAFVIVAAMATALASGPSFPDVLDQVGKAFVNRSVSLFLLTLPMIAMSERYGLKEQAVVPIKRLHGVTPGSWVPGRMPRARGLSRRAPTIHPCSDATPRGPPDHRRRSCPAAARRQPRPTGRSTRP